MAMLLRSLVSLRDASGRRRFPHGHALVPGVVALILVGALPVVALPPAVWHEEPGFRWRECAPVSTAGGAAGFAEMQPSTTGIQVSNTVASTVLDANRILANGSGVALGDFDGDGLCDIYLCSLTSGNRLFRNLGDWRFADVTATAGVGCGEHPSTGAVFADVNGDGRPDLLVNQLGHGTRLFLNAGSGRFTGSTDSGLLDRCGSHSLTLADIDGDGDLDLYVVNYRASTFKDLESDAQIRIRNVNGKYVVPPELAEQFTVLSTPTGTALVEVGEPDQLYLNDGHGRFQAVSWTNGVFMDSKGAPLRSPPRDWGLSAQFRDVNGDGAPDLYVCNDFFSPDRLWINDGKGRFAPVARSALRDFPFASMAVDFADINRDGHDDFFVAEMLSMSHTRRSVQRDNFELEPIPWGGWPYEDPLIWDSQPQLKRNTLLVNRGDNTYAELAHFAGVQASGWSWGCLFLDVDLDGYEDLLLATGHPHDATDSDALRQFDSRRRGAKGRMAETTSSFPPLPLPKVAFRNRGDLTFADVSREWGFNSTGVSQGMALADLDGDGDLDVVINRMNAPVEILRNEATAPRVAVRLRGTRGNRQGIGARISVTGGPVPQSQQIISGGRYLSGDDSIRTFAAGAMTNQLRIEVRWRSGSTSVLERAIPNRIYEIDEHEVAPGEVLAAGSKPGSVEVGFFEDVSG
ncbi:MAG TPA: hypothetical protein DCM86_01290, partial [Verrucomicrobiales bacterium]|nr:hypothetical protein [Verrucomicrobiales bacterium]